MFKPAIVSAVLILVATAAQAEASLALDCKPDATSTVAKDPIVSIAVSVHGQEWRVTHIAASGARYERAQQYSLADTSDSGGLSWVGKLAGRPYLTMFGYIFGVGNNFTYVESLHDARKGDAKIMEPRASCTSLQPTPSVALSTETPASQPIPQQAPTTADTQPEIDAATLQKAQQQIGEALKDPQKVKLMECVGVKVYEDPQPAGHPPNADECDQILKQANNASSHSASQVTQQPAALAPPATSPPAPEITPNADPIINQTVASDDLVSMSKNDSVSPGIIWALNLTGKADSVTIQNVIVNRGNCKAQNPPQLPQTFKFGETRLYGYYLCDPIEAQVVTNKGNSTITWDEFTQNAVSIEKSDQYGNGFWQLVFTSHTYSLTIKSVVVNRGNCKNEDMRGRLPQVLKFGQRYISMALCNPLEVEVTTELGSSTFTWNE